MHQDMCIPLYLVYTVCTLSFLVKTRRDGEMEEQQRSLLQDNSSDEDSASRRYVYIYFFGKLIDHVI